MSRTLLVQTTTFKDFPPLGWSGQLVIEHWQTLHDLLVQKLGMAHAALLLEPVIDRQRGVVDWYLIESGLPNMSNASRQQIVESGRKLIGEARQLAYTLIQSPSETEQTTGELLKLALSYPSENCIVKTPYGPALVAWGHQSSGQQITPQDLAARGEEGRLTKPNVFLHTVPIINIKSLTPVWALFLLLGLLLLTLLLWLLPWGQGWITLWDYCRLSWLLPVLIAIPFIGGAILGHILRKRHSDGGTVNG